MMVLERFDMFFLLGSNCCLTLRRCNSIPIIGLGQKIAGSTKMYYAMKFLNWMYSTGKEDKRCLYRQAKGKGKSCFLAYLTFSPDFTTHSVE